jgi:hypothetical protein
MMSCSPSPSTLDFSNFPHTWIENEQVRMQLFLPDAEKGLYRATRFDWSGVIMSTTWKGHEYFGYWKSTHDPEFHEDLAGPVEGYHSPGPGYEEAAVGEGFIRIGVGLVQKEEEEAYQWNRTYAILDHGRWKVDQGKDWITFMHSLDTETGYAYVYSKKISLTDNGFRIQHTLRNTGQKPLETDQFNHNFFMIDGTGSGPDYEVHFPFDLVSEDDMKGLYQLDGNSLTFLRPVEGGGPFVRLSGYGNTAEDHRFTVTNTRSGAGVHVKMDKPLHDLGFWSCATTLCPENFIWISVQAGQEESWTADYTFFEN